MGSDDQALTLGLGFAPSTTTKQSPPPPPPPSTVFHGYEPSLTLSLSGESYYHQPPTSADHHHVMIKKIEQSVSAAASASSLSNTTATAAAPGGGVLSVKRERETASSEDLDMERGGSSRVASDDEEDGSGPVGGAATRKKLRLTKDQSALLEESFKQHSTLNPKQKQALAERLNLRPRQVEVWFQNRRARTKLKQTEVDCEYLKKCCQTLTDENRRLQKELEELKAMKMGQPSFYMHLPAATLTMCPSCERIGAAPPPNATAVAASKAAAPLSFAMGPGPGPGSKAHFYSAFPNPTAC